MSNWIDTQQSYLEHKRRCDWSALIRNYVAGHPYDDPNEPGNFSNRMLWQRLMRKGRPDEPPLYLRNLASELLTVIVQDMLPSGTGFSLKDAVDVEPDDFLRENFTLGPEFGDGVRGLLDWCRSVITDAAKAGAGILVLRMDFDGDKQRAWFDYFPGEFWRREKDPLTGKVLFDRLEYKYEVPDGLNVKWKWYREDFYADRIVRYEPTDVDPPGGLPLLSAQTIKPVTEMLSSHRPPAVMNPDTSEAATIRGMVEAEMLKKLGRSVVFPIFWRRGEHSSEYGLPELTHSQIEDIDLANEMLMEYSRAAQNVGNPALTLINLNIPRPPKDSRPASNEQGGNSKVFDHLAWAQQIVGPGAVNAFDTKSGEQGGIKYPDNLPKEFPHPQVGQALTDAFHGHAADARGGRRQMSQLGQMSGFLSLELRHDHDETVSERADRVLGTLLEAFNAGIKLLDIAGRLSGDLKTTKLDFKFGRRRKTSDEESKDVVSNIMMLSNGMPAEELIDRWPFEVNDPAKVNAALTEFFNAARVDPLARQLQAAGDPAKPEEQMPPLKPEAAAGVDNNGK